MEKTLEILEKNVQWIVLGLGALFLAWVAYAYVVIPPATVKIGKTVVVPADVDPAINSGVAKPLDNEIKRKDPADFPTPDLVSSWRNHMQAPVLLAAFPPVFNVLPPNEIETGPNIKYGPVHVASLPVLPKAMALPPIAGMSVVQMVVPGAAAANPNPVQPAALAEGKDLLWVTAGATIPGKLLAQAMLAPLKGQTGDPTLYNSTLIEVMLQRQRSIGVDVNGNPVFPQGDKNVEDIAPLGIHQADLKKPPIGNVEIGKKYEFLTWSQLHQDLIATPAFYTVVAGSPWATPQNPPAAPGTAPTTQDATTQPGDAPAPPPATPPAPELKASTGRTPFRANASYAPLDMGRPAAPAWVGERGSAPSFNGGGVPNAPGAGGAMINPFAIQDDIQIWAHDETVKPGQTYRYRFIYQMKNPVFGVQNMAKPDQVDQLAIKSPPSDWSLPVTVPETTKYWLAQIQQLSQPAKMDVAQWVSGQWTMKKNLPLSPGDAVPGTDLTLVDVRSADPKAVQKDKYVLLASDTGEIKRRDLTTDVNDPDHQTMLNQLSPNPVAPNSPAPLPRRPIPNRTPALPTRHN